MNYSKANKIIKPASKPTNTKQKDSLTDSELEDVSLPEENIKVSQFDHDDDESDLDSDGLEDQIDETLSGEEEEAEDDNEVISINNPQ